MKSQGRRELKGHGFSGGDLQPGHMAVQSPSGSLSHLKTNSGQGLQGPFKGRNPLISPGIVMNSQARIGPMPALLALLGGLPCSAANYIQPITILQNPKPEKYQQLLSQLPAGDPIPAPSEA